MTEQISEGDASCVFVLVKYMCAGREHQRVRIDSMTKHDDSLRTRVVSYAD
jgi:hypothetical protein